MNERIKMAVSPCLLGEKVRYDGGHKRDDFIVETLGQFFQWVPICPEVECGLPVPREAMRLTGDPESPRLVTIRSGVDHTDTMAGWARKRMKGLESEDLCGYICKKDSPSSGLERVKVYGDSGVPAKVGRGLFVRMFIEHFPLVPVEDEGRLHDPVLREMFIERVFCLRRFRGSLAQGKGRGRLVGFHTNEKLLILSHNPSVYRRMGKLVAEAKGTPIDDLYARYEILLIEALRSKTTASKNANVLLHMMGYFKQDLSADEKQELLDVIGRFRRGLIPLVVPVTLIQHYVRKYNTAYLMRQTFLNPHPAELMLRNHV